MSKWVNFLFYSFRRDLEEAEDQFQMALRTHLQNLDTLIQLHDSRLYSVEKNFQTDLKTMQSDFHLEKEKMLIKFRQEKKELQAVIETIESDENDRESEAKHSFEQLREEIRNRNLEEINMLRISLDAQIEDLEQHFETAHLNYLQQTAQRTHDFKELTQNDQRLSHEIELKKKKIDNLQTSIQQWRAKIRQLNRETEERNRLLLEEKHSIQKHYQQLKQRIQAYRATQNQRLLQLSQSANTCKTTLKSKLELAARVLQMAELARKLETEQEQILPFMCEVEEEEPPPPTASTEVKKGKNQRDSDKENEFSTAQSSVWAPPSRNSHEERFVPAEDRMLNFHRKYNKALLDTMAIDKEKQRLTEENAQLQDLITQFINGTRVSDAILSDDNPLFVVNGRANLNHNPPVRAIRPTIQDAATIQNTAMISRR